MTSPPDNAGNAAQKAEYADLSVIMSSMEEVVAALLTGEGFEEYRVDDPEDNSVCVERDGLTKILLGPASWKSPQHRQPFLERAQEEHICLVLVGNDDDFAELPADLRRPDVQRLGLPLSPGTLKAALQSLHNFQTLIVDSHAEARQVAEASENVKYVMSISRELNGVRDIPKLLDLILTKARDICNADAGSIYTVETTTDSVKDGTIRFRLTQNHSITQNLTEFTMPVSERSIVGNACIHEQCINIPDLYCLSENPEENPFGAQHDRTFDQRIGYESHSMLTVPMFDISHNVIGVIQLINRKRDKEKTLTCPEDFYDQVVPFDEVDQEYAEVVAQQAGIALENANMQEEIQSLFDGFVNASVTAIEQRDPTTSGHSHRVAYLTVSLAEILDRTETGPYKDVRFNENQIQEIEYASLLHDFGKLGVRENVLIKAKKLYPSQLQVVLQRFELIRSRLEVDYLKKLVEYLQAPDHFPMGANPENFENEKQQKLKEIDEYLEFVKKANEPTVLETGGFEKLKDIANMNFSTTHGEKHPYLLGDELKALSVSRGSLTREEFAEIQSHVTHTFDFLRQIPWGRKLSNVPQIAAKHHEKLDGSGYPTSAEAHEIPVQTRLMTIADIFDALTAADRPYKKAVPVDRALDILNMEVNSGKLDADLFEMFKESKVYEDVLDPNFSYRK